MQRNFLLVAAIFVLVALSPSLARGNDSFSHVEYQGHTIALTKSYADVNEYLDDPQNLTDAQSKLASSLVRKSPFGPRFSDAGAILDALDKLQFPGYGYVFTNQVGAKLDPRLEFSFVELPKARANRYLVTELQPNGTYLVVADFVAPSEPEITRVSRRSNGKLEYRGTSGVIVPK